jgi:phosphate-selective porin
MRIVRIFSLLLAFACLGLVVRAEGSGKNSPGEAGATGSTATSSETAKPADAAPAKPAAPVAATREEVEELRAEVAELKAVIKKLMEAKAQPEPAAAPAAAKAAPAPSAAKLAAASPAAPAAANDTGADEALTDADPLDVDALLQASKGAAQQKPAAAPVSAGWNGEHFFIQSPDKQFQIQPYGYVQTDFRSYDGDGSPANTFAVRRARFGFQGNYGSHFQFAILTDAASSGTGAGGAIVRDVYLNWKWNNEFQIQGGQYKEPFAQELVTGITNIDFVERGLQSLLYPSGVFAFRSPGATIHGDINKGVIQYWAGIFNGKGYANASNTTSVPETVGRIRLYPWRNHKDSWLQSLAFGGSIAYSYAAGIGNELSPRLTEPDFAYTFFPQFRINGNVWRGEGEFTFLHGPLGLRAEYVQAQFDRSGVGTLQFGGLGFQNLPTIRSKAYNISGTWLLTGEKRPENGTPRVKHPIFGPETPGVSGKGWGAFEVAFRYSGIQANEPGIFFNNVFTPELVPTFDYRTDEFTAGLNWYLNYWVRYQTNISVDRLHQPSTIGALPQNYLVFEQRIQFRF